jgi:clathrin heavy chain
MDAEALSVLLNEIQDLNRGAEFVEKVNTKELWSLLGNSYLNNSQIDMALDCYLKSQDANTFGQVIGMGEAYA